MFTQSLSTVRTDIWAGPVKSSMVSELPTKSAYKTEIILSETSKERVKPAHPEITECFNPRIPLLEPPLISQSEVGKLNADLQYN